MNESPELRDRWRRAGEVFDRAAELASEPRSRYLEQVFAREPELRTEVEGLLAADAVDAGVLEQPVERYAAMLEPADLEADTRVAAIPERIGPYRLIRQLGAGGMGVVYEAEDGRLGRRIALKLLADEHAASDPGFRRFEREARALARLNHPHIVTIHSVEQDEGRPFFTMELVDGASLDRLIPRGGLPLDRLLRWSADLAAALAAAHGRGIVHRDLKPANVMVASGGAPGEDRVKVLDFGLATRSAGEGDSSPGERPMTEAGMILGTVPYMSPEQADGLPVDERSDLFSFGSVLYEMACGERPFEGETRARILSSILRDDPVPLAERRRDLPGRFVELVEACHRKDPERRPSSAARIGEQLEELRLERASGAFADRAHAPRKRLVAGVALLAALVVIGLLAPRLWRGPTTTATPDATAPEVATAAARAPAPEGALPRVEATLAVLPFDSLGEAVDAYFAAGLADEISSRLTEIGGLALISRKSTRRWASEDSDAASLGEALGADYLLEGAVRWSADPDGGTRVRVTPRLVRVEDDQQLWSRSYTRLLEDVLDLESSIAGSVVTALRVALPSLEEPVPPDPGNGTVLADRPTDDLDAYFAYLRGVEALSRPVLRGEDRLEAIGHLEEAVRLDPDFTLAWVRLSITRASAVWFRGDPRPGDSATYERARREAARAAELEPEEPTVLLADGFVRYYADRDYPAAADLFDRVVAARPSDVDALMALGAIQRRLGDFEVALDAFDRAVELEPNDPHTLAEAARTHLGVRQLERAAALYDRALALAPDSVDAASGRALVARKQGDLALAQRYIDQTGNPFADFELPRLARDLAAYHAALDATEPPMQPVSPDRGRWIAHKAWALRASGRALDAERLLEEGLEVVDALEPRDPERAPILRVPILAMLGRREEAVSTAERLPERIGEGPTGDHWWGSQMGGHVTWGLALAGAEDEAIDRLERLLATPGRDPLTVWELELDPYWDPLRENPRFAELTSALR